MRDDYRYSLPTICDAIPVAGPLVESELPVMRMHEDDWRQVEFLSVDLAVAIQAEVDEVLAVRAEAAVEGLPGFRRVHVRAEPNSPFGGLGLNRQLVEARFDGVGQFRSVGYEHHEGEIRGSFAFVTAGGLVVYGLAPGEHLHTLGIAERPRQLHNDDAEAIARFNDEFDLVLVNWVRGAARRSPAGEIRALLDY